jgi:hypothetical protein
MGFNDSGYVLRPPRTAPANARTTAEAGNGVLRDHKALPNPLYTYVVQNAEVAADQYRAAVLQNLRNATEEYLLWAANSSSISRREDPTWIETASNPSDTVAIPTGEITVTDLLSPPLNTRDDGSSRLVVQDTGGRSLSDIRLITIRRADLGTDVEVGPDAVGGPTFDFSSQDADAGIVTLSSAALTALGGGVSRSRGDVANRVDYVLAAARFHWTRNDPGCTRFGWDGKTNRWSPLKGSPVRNLDVLSDSGEYILFPRPSRFTVGEYLPYSAASADSFALVRVGIRPDATGDCPEILVVTDEEAEETYTFGGSSPEAVVGHTSGILQFNPDYIEQYAGQIVWYNPESFVQDSDGSLGSLLGSDTEPLFLSPIPEALDLALVKLGFRRYLTAEGVMDDNTLASTVVAAGSFAWSQTTGKIKLNAADVALADPDDPGFDVRYLGAQVYYDGISMAQETNSTRDAVQLVDDMGAPSAVGTGDLYIPLAEPLPSPGVSGVTYIPDGTGVIPNVLLPGTRPNGSGLVREVEGFGDLVLFTKTGVIENVVVVEFEDDLPNFPFQISEGTAYIAKEAGTGGSRVMLSRKDLRNYDGEALYFLQADVQAARRPTQARIHSREQGSFNLEGTEKLYFAIAGVKYVWDASTNLGAGTFSAAVVAADILTFITGAGTAYALRDRVVLEAADPDSGTVEIGFGPGSPSPFDDRDFSGAALLGFLPGWRVNSTRGLSDDWLPDNGSSLGVFRSPVNRNGSTTTADIQNRSRVEEEVFAEDVQPNPVFPLTNPPLRDVAGFDDDVFFRVVDGLNIRPLDHYADVLYQFAEDKFLWLEAGRTLSRVDHTISALGFDDPGVVGDTLHPSVATGNGLYVAEDGQNFVLQVEDTDFLLPAEGAQGIAILSSVVGELVTDGGAGSFVGGTTTFTDLNATFITDGVTGGYRLRILAGDAAGSYIVASVTSESVLEVVATVPFVASAGPAQSTPYAAWRIHEGFPDSVYDPALVADVQYRQFNHLAAEPFKIRLLESLGATPATPAAQSSGRLVAPTTEGYLRGRTMVVRFGLAYASAEASLTALARGEVLGVMANESLYIDTTDAHFTAETFGLRVGSKPYPVGTGTGTVEVVAALTPGLTGDLIEALDTTGELNFGTTTLSNLEGSYVQYDQEFLTPAVLVAGQAEYDPNNGEINLSAADMTAHGGAAAYFVEQMITENRLDVVCSPLIGSFYINRALRDGQIVEAEYFQADSQGVQIGSVIVEFLPLVIRQEVATRVSSIIYTVNPTSRTISANIEPMIWVDSQLQNYGNANDVSFSNGELVFNEEVDASAVVQVNYGVLEAFGGEQAYNTSTTPVWRPPFYLLESQNTFTLDGNRTGELPVGTLLRLGPVPLYVKASVYSGATQETTVTLWPTPTAEAGSRAPGNDVLTLITDVPVTTDVDGVPAGGTAGFLMTLSAAYEPADKGMLSILFYGNVTQYAVAGHLLEMAGYPFLIVGSELAEDGRTTKVDLSNALPKPMIAGTDVVKISVRPIYNTDPTTFVGIAPFVDTEDVELVLFGERGRTGTLQPGRTLTRGVHYQANPEDGSVELLEPVQVALAADQRLLFNYTQVRVLQPLLEDEAVIYPRYVARYAYVTAPSEENSFLGTTLQATYSFRSPDSFYFRTLPLTSYMSEVAELAVQRVEAQNPSGGAVMATFGSSDNQDQGNLGLRSERRDLTDQDRAARTFIAFYNAIIVAFEQVLEAISGEVIGDRDGKFRFFVGQDKTYAPTGYEDGVTGLLNPRLIWSEVFLAASGAFGVQESDPIVDPETAVQNPLTLVVDGVPMSPFMLRYYVEQQVTLLANDMDDQVLAGIRRPVLRPTFPLPTFSIPGRFLAMWDAHRFSRLFPERALAFTTTFPGLGANLDIGYRGVYSFLKMIDPPATQQQEDEGPIAASTFATPIGSIANPSLGVIDNLTDAQPRARLPRARIWAYLPEGSAELDSALGTTTAGIATIIATPLYLKDFPVDATTSWPDTTRLLSVNPLTGDLPDLGTGDCELSTPPFAALDPTRNVFPQVSFGRPTGETFAVGDSRTAIDTLFGGGGAGIPIDPIYSGIFVGSVQAGCVITLAAEDGTDLRGDDIVSLGKTSLSGTPLSLEEGDTIYVIPPRTRDASGMDDPPTMEDTFSFTSGIPVYRSGFDVGVQRRGGNFLDLSLPSLHDPAFPIQEMLGQKPVAPITTIEADVEFVNNKRSPHAFPALLGEDKNDSGDHTIPYLGTRNTELERLQDAARAIPALFEDTTYVPLPGEQVWLSIYPDEILGSDGTILPVLGIGPPATLLTARDLEPVGAGPYVANSGVGDLAAFDLLLVEKPSTASGIPIGSTGILSVGRVGTGTIEPPRFVTQTIRGDVIRYTMTSAMTHISQTGVSGMEITVAAAGPNWLTTFDISTTALPVFNDGGGPGINGGLNNIFVGPGNAALIRLYDNATGALIEEIVLSQTACVGGAGTGTPVGTVDADEKTITVTTNNPFVLTPGIVLDYTLSIDTLITPTTTAASGGALATGSGTGSTTARVGRDRLTFSERVDLETAADRDATTSPPGSTDIGSRLSVWEITASGTAGVTVNDPVEVNGGDAFTFLERTLGGGIGSWVPASGPGAGDELGSSRVMGFEGHNNTVIATVPGTPFTFSAVPSSEYGPADIICNGMGTVPDIGTWVEAPIVLNGAVSSIVAGDTLVITRSIVNDAAVKSGTYLVRHAVEEIGATPGAREVALTAMAGPSSSGTWFEVLFPSLVDFDEVALTLEVSDTSGPGPGNSAWTATGRVYLIPNPADPTTVVSMAYSALAADVFTLTAGSGQDALSAPILDAAFFAAAVVGQQVTGMMYADIGGYPTPLPDNNLVGFDSTGTSAGGYRDIIFCNPTYTGDAAANQTLFSFGGGNLVVGLPAGGQLGVVIPAAADAKVFQTDVTLPIYDNVASYFDLTGISFTQWNDVHDTGIATSGIIAPLPFDQFVCSTTVNAAAEPTGTEGFAAIAGVFLEPSFARPTTDLNLIEPHVVDAGSTASSNDYIGMRPALAFGLPTAQEDVTFEIRRIRRFHEVQDTITATLTPLRFAYEIRQGDVDATSTATLLVADTATYGTATQLGDFDDPDVNVHPGDTVRLIRAGVVIDTAPVGSILTASSILLQAPGFTEATPAGTDTFEVYLRQAPVPHEQSNEQLLGLLTDETVHETAPNYGTQAGGLVTVLNQLQDNTVPDFSVLGVQEGDYIVIDPAGDVEGPSAPASPPERGVRPIGDTAVAARAEFVAGIPSELDDNRGFYRVLDPQAAFLEVTGVSEFSGDSGSEIVFGEVGQEYAVLPTVTGPPAEGQQDLRLTAQASPVTNSFKGTPESIEPFGYRIIRPSSLFSQEAAETILFLRERMLSWVEEIRRVMGGFKSGTYFVFQRDEHITDLGSPTDPDDGLGVLSNLYIESVQGMVGSSPFANVSDCLSILDRRYWVLDYQLDWETPPLSVTPYASFEADSPGVPPLIGGSGRPVLPDRVTGVLDLVDRFRSMRYAWIQFRCDRVYGSLPAIERFDEELPRRLAEQETLLRLKEGLNEI